VHRVSALIERVVSEPIDSGEELADTALLTVVHWRLSRSLLK
jgi:hypothetical protein